MRRRTKGFFRHTEQTHGLGGDLQDATISSCTTFHEIDVGQCLLIGLPIGKKNADPPFKLSWSAAESKNSLLVPCFHPSVETQALSCCAGGRWLQAGMPVSMHAVRATLMIRLVRRRSGHQSSGQRPMHCAHAKCRLAWWTTEISRSVDPKPSSTVQRMQLPWQLVLIQCQHPMPISHHQNTTCCLQRWRLVRTQHQL